MVSVFLLLCVVLISVLVLFYIGVMLCSLYRYGYRFIRLLLDSMCLLFICDQCCSSLFSICSFSVLLVLSVVWLILLVSIGCLLLVKCSVVLRLVFVFSISVGNVCVGLVLLFNGISVFGCRQGMVNVIVLKLLISCSLCSLDCVWVVDSEIVYGRLELISMLLLSRLVMVIIVVCIGWLRLVVKLVRIVVRFGCLVQVQV